MTASQFLLAFASGMCSMMALVLMRPTMVDVYTSARNWMDDLRWAIKLNAKMYRDKARGLVKYQRRGGLRFLKVGRLSVQWSIAKPTGGAPSRTKARKAVPMSGSGKELGITNGWNV